MTGASRRSRRPTEHRAVELHGMRFEDEARASGRTIVANRVDEVGRSAPPSTTHRRSFHGTQAWLFS